MQTISELERHSGYLFKKSNLGLVWNQRFVELEGNCFNYRNSPNEAIKAEGKVVSVAKEVGQTRFCFKIELEEGGEIVFGTELESERDEWMEILTRCIEANKIGISLDNKWNSNASNNRMSSLSPVGRNLALSPVGLSLSPSKISNTRSSRNSIFSFDLLSPVTIIENSATPVGLSPLNSDFSINRKSVLGFNFPPHYARKMSVTPRRAKAIIPVRIEYTFDDAQSPVGLSPADDNSSPQPRNCRSDSSTSFNEDSKMSTFNSLKLAF